MTRVVVTGTFNLLHEGQMTFLREARDFGNELYVLLASDRVATAIKSRTPSQSEQERLINLKGLDFVTEVVIKDELASIDGVLGARPDVVVLGYDQQSRHIRLMEEYCQQHEIPVHRLTEFVSGIHTTQLLNMKSGETK